MVGTFVRAGLQAIKGVKPFKKFKGQKTVEQHKKQISDMKSEAIGKKYRDELKAAGAKLTATVNQTGKSLNQLNETLKKGALKKVKEGK
tara:strand:+ start:194 stop:460 length:267 start_codon:yes stop_codon:yes gene_type:complete